MANTAQDIAACLGLEGTQIRKLQARGYLRALDLTPTQIRERLYHAHLRHQYRARFAGELSALQASPDVRIAGLLLPYRNRFARH